MVAWHGAIGCLSMPCTVARACAITLRGRRPSLHVQAVRLAPDKNPRYRREFVEHAVHIVALGSSWYASLTSSQLRQEPWPSRGWKKPTGVYIYIVSGANQVLFFVDRLGYSR